METIVLENLTFTTLTDEILAVEALRQPDAFAELYRRHFIQIYRYHMGRTGRIQEAEDLTTVTFVAALEGIRKFKGTGSFQAWLFGIARHQQLMQYRSRKREVDLELANNKQDSATPLEILASQRLQIGQVRRSLGLLSDDRRETILLCIFADLSAEEAAEILGKTPSAVKMLLLRGLRDIRNILSTNEKD
jgi:RNA polymerase sigma-70 factor, ECF subfamily